MKDCCNGDNLEVLKLNADIYSKDAVMKTAYVFLDRVYILIDQEDNYYKLELRPKEQGTYDDSSLMKISGEFQNELLNQEIRKKVMEDTRNVRELILARAMYSSFIETPQMPEQSAETYSIDDIAKDWYANGKE